MRRRIITLVVCGMLALAGIVTFSLLPGSYARPRPGALPPRTPIAATQTPVPEAPAAPAAPAEQSLPPEPTATPVLRIDFEPTVVSEAR